jgi:hypothetical protein
MLIDVGDPLRNLVLNACFCFTIFLALVAIVPWKALGAARLSRILRWSVVPVLGLATVYEAVMPSRFDIRMDLFLLLPAYAVVIVTSAARWLTWRRSEPSVPAA